jgi:predicted permease
MIYAAVIGVTLLTTDTPLPKTLANTVQLLGGLAIPLMLLALGHSLANFRVTRPAKAIGLAAFRLVLGFSVGVGVAELFRCLIFCWRLVMIGTRMTLPARSWYRRFCPFLQCPR